MDSSKAVMHLPVKKAIIGSNPIYPAWQIKYLQRY